MAKESSSVNSPISSIHPAIHSDLLAAPGSLASPRLRTLIKVGRQPSSAMLPRDGKELYVSESKSDSVSIIDPSSNQVVAHVAVGHEPTVLASSKQGERVYVAQAGGGVGIIDTITHSFRLVPVFSKPVMDLVLTPDGKRLYVSYQAGGPDGYSGRDSIGYFDTSKDL